MRVKQSLRGGKKGAPRGRGREQRKPFPKADLMVTLPNEERKESRLKPPVNGTQPRKIVRISQNKTETTDLDKVTVKSLEEIKREKELRKESAVLSRSSIPPLHDLASQIANGSAADSSENDVNGCKPTSSVSVPGLGTAKPKLRDFSIPLKPLPAQSSANCKILHAKTQVATVSSLSQVEEHEIETHEVQMDFDSKLAEQDFDYLDDDEEESDSVGEYDEDFLLKEDEDIEMEGDSSLKQSLNSNFSSYTSDEPEDDEISLHPDDSLFDEEDEPKSSNFRTLGRRSGSQLKDLRSQITDRQKENSTKMINITVGEPEGNEVRDERQGMCESSEQDDSLLKRSENGERDPRNSSHKRSSRERDNRDRPRDSRHFVDRRTGRAQFRGSVRRRGKGIHGSRQAPRKGNVPNVFPNTIPPLPSLLGHGGGLLPLPSPANMGFVSQIQRALQADIANNLKTQVEMLTNPPPVPGEIVTNFDQSKKHTAVLRGSRNVSNGFRNSGRHSARRTHNTQPKLSSVSKQSSTSTVTQPTQVSSQQNVIKGRDIPKWLQKTYKQSQESQANAVRGFTSIKVEQNTAVSPRSKNTASAKESFEYGHSSRPIIDSMLTHRSPHADSKVEMQLSSNKRRSPFHAEEVPHGGKIVVATSPEGIPQPRMQNRSPKQLSPEQFQTGSCLNKPWHLPKQELEEHQKLHQLGHVNSQDHPVVVKPASVQQQIKVDIPDVSYNLVNELLQNGNLGAAWQMIEKLRGMNRPPDLSVLQHVLTLCSKHLQDPDVAAQVAHNAFDMIGGMVVHHNRHNYETLIKTLCHSGQYIRAYEMLEVMKKDSHAPTYDVFLDLVQASVKDPEWAFSLLDEIKQSGVFRSRICSDLILLGCKSGEFFIERTWLLFQEALKNQVQVTAEAISAILFTLAQANEWDKIMSVLVAVSGALPDEILKSAVLMATQKIDWIEAVIAVLTMSPAEKVLVLDEDVWNTFLSNCCTGHGNNILFAQKVYSLMQQNEIPLSPMSVNNYMRALSHCGNWMAALELFTAVHKDPQVVQQPQALESGLLDLSSALQKVAASSGLLRVVHFMMVHHLKPEDSVLQSAVEYLDNEKNYKGVWEFFEQLQENAIVPPLVVYKEIVSSLEKWIEHPEASLEPYAAMRHAYPSGQPHASNKNEASSDSEKNGAPRVCKYVSSPRGCFSGAKCKFVHPEGSMSVHEGSQQTAPQSVKPVPAAALPTLQQNTNSSAGNGPIFNAAAVSEMSPFMLQSTSVKPLPFTMNLGSVQGTSTEQSHGSMKSQKQSQATQLCKFFNTQQWCRWGDNCRFIHHTSSVAMEADSNTVAPERPPVGSTEAGVSKNHTGNPFVLRSLSSTSSFASENRLFGFANNWQPPSSGFQPAANQFQLVDGSQLVGKNPFSLNFPGRTQSLDGSSEREATEHNQRAHSAPVVSERPGISQFYFPSKRSIEVYMDRIQSASQQNRWEDLGYVYVSMKKEAVEINNSVVESFYQSFQNFCAADNVGQSFKRFAERIERNLKETMAELDEVDKEFIGQIGVALMYLCYRSKHFSQGREILYPLHKLGINYYLYSGEFGLQQRPLTAAEVVLTAVDICLNLEKPAYDDALVVLQSTNQALSDYERKTVLTSLCKKFMGDKQLHIVKGLLSQVGNIGILGRDVKNDLYNELVVALIKNNELDVAAEVVKEMEENSILVDSETMRTLVRRFGDAGFGVQAKQYFRNGCDAGVYPDSFKRVNPWTVVIGTSFSAFESQLYVARHLGLLYLYIEELACASGNAVLDDKCHRPLKVVIESDEEQTVVDNFMRGDEIIRFRERLCRVLANDFNPPLACQPKMRDEEVIVDAMSLKRWFCANPASGRSRRPRAHTSGSHPYLLPGMTNLVPTDDQRGDRRVFIVSEADSLAPGNTIVPEEVQPGTFVNQRGQPLTRRVSGRGHPQIIKTT